MSDPDRLVEWDRIEEIHIETHSSIACPICLHEPTAAKMTKCGHVYCWPCLLHYLSLSDKPWRKCPICFESVYKSDLKSARVLKHPRDYRVGEYIEMQLVCKSRSLRYATVCVPTSELDKIGSYEHHVSYETFDELPPQCARYLKIHARSPLHILDTVIRREREELTRQREAEHDQPEVCFVDEALRLLSDREAHVTRQIGCSSPSSSSSSSSSSSEPTSSLGDHSSLTNTTLVPPHEKESVNNHPLDTRQQGTSNLYDADLLYIQH